MLNELQEYLGKSWPALVTGLVIGTIIQPLLKKAVESPPKVVRCCWNGAAERWKAARRSRRLGRAAAGLYVGPLTMGDHQDLTERGVPTSQLHQTYRDELAALERTAASVWASFTADVADLQQHIGRPK